MTDSLPLHSGANTLEALKLFFFLAAETVVIVHVQHPLWWEDRFVSYQYAWPLSSVHIAQIAWYRKFFFCNVYKLSISQGFAGKLMSILFALCYKGSLVPWTVVSQSQSYFTTGSLPPIGSSCPKPLEAYDQIFFLLLQLNPHSHSHYIMSSLTRGWVCLLWIGFASVKCTYRT
jgi:hypothetical protein